ncbi:MAG: flagellar motor protein MotB [Marinilabiliales bacterium]|nr:MAG: flagellar motor protein MotB [Marinilabiliales bacterium]
MSFKIKSFVLFFAVGLALYSCVPTKQFEDLQLKNIKCEEDLELTKEENKHLEVDNTELKAKVDIMSDRLKNLSEDSLERETKFKSIDIKYDKLNRQYEDLLKAQDQLLTGNITETKKLLQELQNTQANIIEKEDQLRQLEDKLNIDQRNLNKYKKELEEKNARLVELETILYKKDSVVNALKDKVSRALMGFTDMGLAVEMKNGKVYVSLDEQLLFKSGSTVVDPKGVSAIKKLADVLAVNQDINIMVEGHTDDVPYIASEAIKDNWDLSVKRATAIVRILMENKNIEGSRIVASGRSKYQPIINSKAPDVRKKNRRTEIILTPKLDELFQILESN